MARFLRSTTEKHPRLFVEHGDLFDLKNGFDGIAAFVPGGITSFRHMCHSFINNDPPGIVMFADLNHHRNIYDERDVWPMVEQAMTQLVRHGAKQIGMNGIRTTGASESCIIDACTRWLKEHEIDAPDVIITLVDFRNSFRHWAITPVDMLQGQV